MTGTRTLQEWFALYAESHRHPVNKAIHVVAVPSIYGSILGLLWAIPVPAFLASLPGMNWAAVAAIPLLLFYRSLSMRLVFVMGVFTGTCFWLLSELVAAGVSVLVPSLVLFVAMWLLQFIGHAIEGRKPSFFQDLQFLLIGPAWVFSFALGDDEG